MRYDLAVKGVIEQGERASTQELLLVSGAIAAMMPR
jgi:hypothetical protein